MLPVKLLQAQHYDTFRCIGAECEDTCCDGWGVTVDRKTYDKYQNCGDPELRSSFRDLVTINTAATSNDDYAMFKLTETHCPFLAQGLCSIQTKLGEDYLSDTCATYRAPRQRALYCWTQIRCGSRRRTRMGITFVPATYLSPIRQTPVMETS